MEERSAPLRSGSLFVGDLAAVNLKVDHFSFVSSFQHSHPIPAKGVLILSAVLLKSSQILSCLRNSEGKTQFPDADVLILS